MKIINKNKKGFTLVELLAVIVVLAIVMVLAVPQILNQMNSSKKKSFQLYAQRILSSTMSAYKSDDLLNEITNKRYNGLPCYTLEDLDMETTGSYRGFVTVTHSDVGDTTTYNIYLTDSTYAYNGTGSDDVYNNPKIIGTSADAVSAVDAIVGKDGTSHTTKCQ